MIRITPPCLTRLLCALALCVAACIGLPSAAQSGPALDPVRLDGGDGPAQGVSIAATGPERVAIGWTDTAQTTGAVYLRLRLNRLWNPALRVAGDCGRLPRDLELFYTAGSDSQPGLLRLVWTALNAAGRRVLYTATQQEPAKAPVAAPLLPGPAGAAEAGECDFPTIEGDAAGGLHIVWQETFAVRSVIRAAYLAPDGGAPIDRGTVSGAGLTGMAPQLVGRDPVQVAWYEIGQIESTLRVDEWIAAENRWRPSALERRLASLPANGQVLLQRVDSGLIACWQELNDFGHSILKSSWLTLEGAAPAAPVITLGDPSRDHGSPSLGGSLPRGVTVAWQVRRGGINLARGLGEARPPRIVGLSRPDQQFAASPDHVTLGDWSAAAWLDDALEGGGGGIYFNEVTWPAQP